MQRTFTTFTTLALLAASATAQCLDTSSVGSTLGSGDQVHFGPVAMGISFPMAGATGTPFTHCVVSSNGLLYLTNGGAATDASLLHLGGNVPALRGAAGASPRIAPFWSDLVTTGPAGFVAIDTSVVGRCAVTWVMANEWLQLPQKSFKAELFSTGEVRFSYSGGMVCDAQPATVGLSIGNAVADPGASDLSGDFLSSPGIVYQVFDPIVVPFDLGGSTLTFTPSGASYHVHRTCEAANNRSYGEGCYSIPDESFYQYFATAAAASAALNGQSMTLTPNGNGYSVAWGGGIYVAPTIAATVLLTTDDAQVSVTPSIPLPVPGGSAPTLFVHGNGFVSTGAANDAPYGGALWNPPSLEDFEPSPAFRNAPATAFWSWHDYNPESGLGRIKRQEAVVGPHTVLYITWDAVESYPSATANPSTFQFQFNLTTGVVTYVWFSITAIGTAGNPAFPESHLIGYSPGGNSADTGAINLASALPLTTSPDLQPLKLTISPAPLFTLGNPSVPLTWQIDNLRDLSPAVPGVYLAALVASLNPGPGIDLTLIGLDAPGCKLNVGGADIVIGLSPVGPSHSLIASVPQPLSPGNVFYFQAINFVIPFSLPNGLNGLGMTASNGVRSYFQTF